METDARVVLRYEELPSCFAEGCNDHANRARIRVRAPVCFLLAGDLPVQPSCRATVEVIPRRSPDKRAQGYNHGGLGSIRLLHPGCLRGCSNQAALRLWGCQPFF